MPDGTRATLVGLTLTSPKARTVPLALDAHSELMCVLPVGLDHAERRRRFNLPDTGAFDDGRAAVPRARARRRSPTPSPHDWAALVAGAAAADVPRSSARTTAARRTRPSSARPTAPRPHDVRRQRLRQGHRRAAALAGPAGRPTSRPPCGSRSPARTRASSAARTSCTKALADPAEAAAAEGRRPAADRRAHTQVDLPGDPLLEQSIAWSKQNLADSVQEAHDLQLRAGQGGPRQYPPAEGTLATARWLGAGWPDYPWLFGTDGEYTAFASVAMGQFDDIKAHLRALRDVSDVVNGDSGKVVHEVMPDGSIYYGTLDSAGNTDETSKFPSAVALIWRWTGDDAFRDDLYDFAVRNMQYVVEQLDDDGDGWPEGLGNVERTGHGRGEARQHRLHDPRPARPRRPGAQQGRRPRPRRWATDRAAAMEAAFESAWWYGGDTDQYADSIDDPANPANDNTKILQRHWIGVTPMDAELVRHGQVTRPLATDEHGETGARAAPGALLLRRVRAVPHRHRPDLGRGRQPRPVLRQRRSRRCRASGRSSRSTPGSWRSPRATSAGSARTSSSATRPATPASSSTRACGRCPGAMPEIAPSPDFPANIDRPLYDRSMVLQAWGAYGTLWPVVHQQLGVSPDLGRGDARRWCRRSRTARAGSPAATSGSATARSTSRPSGPRRR